ncbi:MAG: hypothetical protein Q9219_006796 [cf. Caloplaca sp. 3 TL-2023]
MHRAFTRPCSQWIHRANARRYSQGKSTPAWQQNKHYTASYAVIAVCCSGFAYNWYADDQATKKRNSKHRNFIDRNLVFSQQNYDAGRWWTIITHSVMHFHGTHLAFNMVALASFGPTSILMFGLPSTAIMWAGSSASGAWFYTAGNRFKAEKARERVAPKELEHLGRVPSEQPAPPETSPPILGASSSILGLFAAVACVKPKASVYIFPLPIPIPMGALALGIGLASAAAYSRDLLPFIGHSGHLGGMAFGTLYYVLRLR